MARHHCDQSKSSDPSPTQTGADTLAADSYVLVWHVAVAVAACGASQEPPERGNVRGHCRERSRDLLCCLVTSDATMRFQDAGFKPRLKRRHSEAMPRHALGHTHTHTHTHTQ